MKYRIAIQEYDGNPKHIHNIMFDTDDIDVCISRIREALASEIEQRESKFLQWLESRKKTMLSECMDDIDWHAKGDDISKEEYFYNECIMEGKQQ